MTTTSCTNITPDPTTRRVPPPQGRRHIPANVLLKTRHSRHSTDSSTTETVRGRGHLDEVQELRKGGSTLQSLELGTKEAETLCLSEGALLGGGAFSRVSSVVEDSTNRCGGRWLGGGQPFDKLGAVLVMRFAQKRV